MRYAFLYNDDKEVVMILISMPIYTGQLASEAQRNQFRSAGKIARLRVCGILSLVFFRLAWVAPAFVVLDQFMNGFRPVYLLFLLAFPT